MKQSESIKELAGALCKAQLKIKAAVKDSTNPHFKNKYADIASVIEAVREPLNSAGISFLQPVSAVDAGVAIETILLHISGEWISETLVMPVGKADAQGVGSAITYGRRYGLMAMCGVPAEDDDGNAATKAAPAITVEQLAELEKGIKEAANATELGHVWKSIVATCKDAGDTATYNALKIKVTSRSTEFPTVLS